MKVVIALDSFKGSLTSFQAGTAVAEGAKRAFQRMEPVICPIADGGEGTVAALVEGLDGTLETVTVSDPLGRKIECTYGIIPKTKTAVIEMSAAAGITLLTKAELNPMHTTTFGVGEMIADAVQKGCRDFIIGIGGSATNDGGIGMLQALGFGILDKGGRQVPFGAKGLAEIETITAEHAMPELAACKFSVACDVENPLCGAAGCSAVFAPQKGADQAMAAQMDQLLLNYAAKVKEVYPLSDCTCPGAGAAGGLGFAFMSFLNGKLEKGIDLIINAVGFEKHLADADLVVTGEGRLDAQSVMGKTPSGIAKMAKRYNVPVIAFAGSVAKDAAICNQQGIDAFFSIAPGVCTLEEAMEYETAYENLANAAEQVFRLVKTIKSL